MAHQSIHSTYLSTLRHKYPTGYEYNCRVGIAHRLVMALQLLL